MLRQQHHGMMKPAQYAAALILVYMHMQYALGVLDDAECNYLQPVVGKADAKECGIQEEQDQGNGIACGQGPGRGICDQVQICEANGSSQEEGDGGDDPGRGYSGRGLVDTASAIKLFQEVDPGRLPGEAARGDEIVHEAAGQVNQEDVFDGHFIVELEGNGPPGQCIA